LAILSLGPTNSRAQLLTNGDFQTAGLQNFGQFTISEHPNAWIAITDQYVLTFPGPSGQPTDLFARHRTAGVGVDEKLVQFIDATGISGKIALNLEYVYEQAAAENPQARISLVGIGADRLYKVWGGSGTDGYDGGSDFSVISPGDVLLAQATLPYSATWTKALTLVGQVSQPFAYIGVVVQSGCWGNSTTCDTLRGTDNFVLVIDEEGPYTKHVTATPNASIFNTPFTVSARIDDTETGNSTIKGAKFTIRSGGSTVVDWTSMDASDGSFDMPFEDVTATYSAGLPIGQYSICVYGIDIADNEGAESCINFVTFDPISENGLNIPISNECAQFYTLENPGAEHEVTTLQYGEDIVFDTRFSLNTSLAISDSGNVNFHFGANAKGDGTGVTSGIKYQFMLNSMLRAKTSLADYDPFTAVFNVKARIVGQPQEIDGYGLLNGAQNNAELLFSLRTRYADGHIYQEAFDFTVQCAGDPWSNLMENRDLDTRQPVGRGFGDEMNKYGWTGVDFGDALIVGTKNAFYDIATYIGGDGGNITNCVNSPPDPSYPDIYWRFACMEIFGYGNSGIRDSHGAQLWRLDYKNKRWQLVYDAVPRHVPEGESGEFIQGFRDSVVHNGKVYVAADLGAFISGVSYVDMFKYPGVALLVSEDGINFSLVPDCPTGPGGLCEAQTAIPPSVPTNNLSIRALASFDGKLFIGTLNNTGGQIWTFDDQTGVFAKVWPAAPMPMFPIIGELEPYHGKLYVGMGGLLTTTSYPDNNYIYACDACDSPGDFAKVPELPDLDANTFFVIKLFAAKDRLFAGTVNFQNGFSLLSYDDSNGGDFDIIVDGPNDGGFFDPLNIYLWSMAEIDGRLVAGTFNPATITEIPRGTAELWYSDDGMDWFQYPMPIGWSLLGYGIRDLVTGDSGKTLFLLSATNMVAPDIVEFDNPLSAGLQVWAIRDTKVVSPSGGKRGKKNH